MRPYTLLLITITLAACTPAQLQTAAVWTGLASQAAQTLLPILGFCEDEGAAQTDTEEARRLTLRALELAEQGDPEAEEALVLAVSAAGSILQRLDARGVDIPPDIERAQRMLVGLVVVPRMEDGLRGLHSAGAVVE